MDLLPPPAGGDQDLGPKLLAIIWVFTILALITVALKLFTRLRILREPGLDDFFILLSITLILTCTCLFTADVHLGMGRHTYYLSPQNASAAVRLNLIANPFAIMAYSLPNISVAIFLNRILSPNRWRRWMIYAIVIAQSVIAAISCVILFTQCTPTASLWDPAVSGTCLPSSVITGYSYFVGAYSAFTDIFLAVIPIAAFWKLQMKLKTKIGLGLLMGMTSIAAIAAIVKTTKLYELADVMDFTYDTVDLVIWAIVEANVIIIAACIPTLRPFVINVQHSVKGSNAHSFFNRRGYKLEDSNKALALHPSYEHSGEFENGITQHATVQGPVNPIFDPSDETGIRQTTKITAEWNQV